MPFISIHMISTEDYRCATSRLPSGFSTFSTFGKPRRQAVNEIAFLPAVVGIGLALTLFMVVLELLTVSVNSYSIDIYIHICKCCHRIMSKR